MGNCKERKLLYDNFSVIHTNYLSGCMRWRYLTAVLCFLTFFSSYCMRSNISVAIVDMVKSNDSNSQGDSQVNSPCELWQFHQCLLMQ